MHSIYKNKKVNEQRVKCINENYILLEYENLNK